MARIEVLYVRRERLRDLDKFGAIEEGFTGETLLSKDRVGPVERFFMYWSELFGGVRQTRIKR